MKKLFSNLIMYLDFIFTKNEEDFYEKYDSHQGSQLHS